MNIGLLQSIIIVIDYSAQELAGGHTPSYRGNLRSYPTRYSGSVESYSLQSGETFPERESIDGKSASSIDSYPDLLGLTEGGVDSDDESDELSQLSAQTIDPLRDSLGKKPSERTEADVQTICNEVSHLPALLKLPVPVRKELCQRMLYKVYKDPGVMLVGHGKELHSWQVLLNGVLEVREEGLPPKLLHVGESFGMPAATQTICNEVSHLPALLKLPVPVRKELCQRMLYKTICNEVSHLPALLKLPVPVRKELCQRMLYKVYKDPGVMLVGHGKELHSWQVLLNGVLEVREEGLPPKLLHVGESFGMPAATQVLRQQGDILTRSPDCHVLSIPRSEFLQIIKLEGKHHFDIYNIFHLPINHSIIYSKSELNTKRIKNEEGKVIVVKELKASVTGCQPGDVITAADPQSLIEHLKENTKSVDPEYTEDFLLTYRIFIPDVTLLTKPLLHWFEDSQYRYKILSIVNAWVSSHFTDFDYNLFDFLLTYRIFIPDVTLLTKPLLHWFEDSQYRYKILSIVNAWVSSHFTDFDYNTTLWKFLEELESQMRTWNLKQELSQFRQLCSSKTLRRTIVIDREKSDPIPLLVGGARLGWLDMVKMNNVCTVAYTTRGRCGVSLCEAAHLRPSSPLIGGGPSPSLSGGERGRERERGERERKRERERWGIERSLPCSTLLPRAPSLNKTKRSEAHSMEYWCGIFVTKVMSGSSFDNSLLRSCDQLLQFNDTKLDQFTEDRIAKMLAQSTKFSLVVRSNKMGMKEAMQRSDDLLRNRQLGTQQRHYSADNISKNKAFSGFIDSLKYKKTPKRGKPDLNDVGTMNASLPLPGASNDDLARSFSPPMDVRSVTSPSLLVSPSRGTKREALKLYREDHTFKYMHVTEETTAQELVYLGLNQFEILEDPAHFSLCEVIAVHAGAVRQKQLSLTTKNLSNRLSLCSRYYLKDNRRTDSLVLEHLAQEMLRDTATNILLLDPEEVARQLTINSFSIFKQGCNNYNTMFCILSGLSHAAVNRLDETWARVPGKWSKVFKDLHGLLDPSRNMFKYRSLMNNAPCRAPMIPFFPVLKKDLTFIHLGIDTKVEGGLINFEKMRMVSREIQNIRRYCSTDYNPHTMFNLGGDLGSVARLRRKESTQTLTSNVKKLYDKGLMQRKVALYLSEITTFNDAKLRQFSHACEAPSPSTFVSTLQRRSLPDLTDVGRITTPTADSTTATSEKRQQQPPLKRSFHLGRSPTISTPLENPQLGRHSPRQFLSLPRPATRSVTLGSKRDISPLARGMEGRLSTERSRQTYAHTDVLVRISEPRDSDGERREGGGENRENDGERRDNERNISRENGERRENRGDFSLETEFPSRLQISEVARNALRGSCISLAGSESNQMTDVSSTPELRKSASVESVNSKRFLSALDEPIGSDRPVPDGADRPIPPAVPPRLDLNSGTKLGKSREVCSKFFKLEQSRSNSVDSLPIQPMKAFKNSSGPSSPHTASQLHLSDQKSDTTV
eukprot:sb/3460876/